MTAVWHVDDMKVSHENPQEVTMFINELKDKFEDENGAMTVHRGKKHTHLGMELDFSEKGKVTVDMINCVTKMVEDFSVTSDETATTPAAVHLFKVDKNCSEPEKERKTCVDAIYIIVSLRYQSEKSCAPYLGKAK